MSDTANAKLVEDATEQTERVFTDLAILPIGAKPAAGIPRRNDGIISRVEKSTDRIRSIIDRFSASRQRVVPSGDKRVSRLLDDLDREISALEELL